MRFRYSTTDSFQNEFDSLPRIPLILSYENQSVEGIGLIDSGSTINVLPYHIGIQLGAVWQEDQAKIQLSGNLKNQLAMPLILMAKVANFPSVRLVFAWVQQETPLILGQTNFFLEFDVYFYRSKLEFEIMPKSD